MNKLLLILFLTSLLLPVTSKASNQHLLFNRPADTPQAKYVIDLMSKAYNQLGYKMHIIDFNHQSALTAANDGTLDGQLGRISSIAKQYKNLKIVNFPLFEFNLVLLKNCLQCSFEQLDSIAIQAGYPAAQEYLDNNPFIGNVVRVKSVTAQLNLLTQKKVSGLVLLDFILHTKHPNFDTSAFQTEVLVPIQSFHFLHKRHSALIPKLEAELIRLHKNGTVQLLRAKYSLD
ncbi:transporter substrate-binding domain-containing protein [Pseudoalteromonas sp. A601]|uniref:transporter substrate-binding domain-containing protein n=1 Tax=Pseudoalteromonas sp. A601 TaxID=1967839 RepID=UPI0020CBDB17|nr:transporter substrate-binding domain-containing protein [Pseudoalteromonas sp. A601]